MLVRTSSQGSKNANSFLIADISLVGQAYTNTPTWDQVFVVIFNGLKIENLVGLKPYMWLMYVFSTYSQKDAKNAIKKY